MEKLSCISCGNYVVIGDGSVKFQCPSCEELIGRCGRCRAQSNRYTCKCGFEGP
ncbi:MAG: zinc finger domain-containing protein [Candidatus Hydrothermarchaeales archaeon]